MTLLPIRVNGIEKIWRGRAKRKYWLMDKRQINNLPLCTAPKQEGKGPPRLSGTPPKQEGSGLRPEINLE
tara:strand:- start:24844 stop:25053 length:210 start_codon:yes stop_codon:yes gene_type:complete